MFHIRMLTYFNYNNLHNTDYVRTFAVEIVPNAKHLNNMSKTEFNKTFSLSLNGKFKGLDAVVNQELLWHKLTKKLRTLERTIGLQDKLELRVSGQKVVLYYR